LDITGKTISISVTSVFSTRCVLSYRDIASVVL